MYFRLVKGATTVAYLSLIVLTCLFIDGGLDWRISLGCDIISGLWLVLTRLQMGHLLKTYFDVLSRLEVTIPMTIGIALSTLALTLPHHPVLRVVAAVEFVVWIYMYFLYRRNRQLYILQGHGPVPAGTWISPPADVLKPGDLLLTSGRVAERLHESVGHGEMVLVSPGGDKMALSSYMARGLVLNPLDEVTIASASQGHYIALRPLHELSPEQVRRGWEIAEDMLAANKAWRDRVNRARQRTVSRLPIPQPWRDRLATSLKATGYDWLGLFMGRMATDHWTCVGACLEVYERLGIKTNPYGTGLLGFGTTLFDPIMPVRFLSDSAFKVLTTNDEAR